MCESGCQMIASAVNGETATKDPLYVGPNNVKKHFSLISDPKIYDYIKNKNDFTAREDLRFRDEGDFYLVNIRWGNTISVDRELGLFLEKFSKSQQSFNIDKFGEENIELLANLFFKDVIESENMIINDDRKMMGVSANIEHIPFINSNYTKTDLLK